MDAIAYTLLAIVCVAIVLAVLLACGVMALVLLLRPPGEE